MAKRFITAQEAARLMNLPLSTVYRKIRQKKLPVAPHGRPYRVDMWEVEKQISGGVAS